MESRLSGKWLARDALNGRTPEVVAFSTVKVSGCLSTAILAPAAGSIGVGAEMFTPGSGPATVGLRGLELFSVAHAVNVQTTASAPMP